jgi:predicted RNA-binding protein YlqC (UPF0109 family)
MATAGEIMALRAKARRGLDVLTLPAVEPRWEAPAALTLVVRARARDEADRLIGRRGEVIEHLRPLAQRVGLRLGLPIAIEVIEA